MTAARIFTPENRLAKILMNLEAPTAAELAADAEARVDRMSSAIQGYVAEKLEEISAYATQSDEALFGDCRALGEAALNVAEVAGAAKMKAVGEIARGVSAMIDSLLQSGVWHTDALRLHIDALALVNQSDAGRPPETEIILERLRAMRESIGVAE